MAEGVEFKIVLVDDGGVGTSGALSAAADSSPLASTMSAALITPDMASPAASATQLASTTHAAASSYMIDKAEITINQASVSGISAAMTEAISSAKSKDGGVSAEAGFRAMAMAGKEALDSIVASQKMLEGMAEAGTREADWVKALRTSSVKNDAGGVSPEAGFRAMGQMGREHLDDINASRKMLEGMAESVARKADWKEVPGAKELMERLEEEKAEKRKRRSRKKGDDDDDDDEEEDPGFIAKSAKVVGQVGNVASDMARNNYAGAAVRIFSDSAKAMEDIPVVGKAVSATFGLAAQSVASFTQVTEAFVAQGIALSRYSGEIQSSMAMAQVRQMQADRHEAETMGSDYARIIEANADIWAEIREFLLPLKQIIAEKLASFMETILDILDSLSPQIEAMVDVVGKILGFLIDFVGGLFKFLASLVGGLPDAMEDAKEKRRKPSEKDAQEFGREQIWEMFNQTIGRQGERAEKPSKASKIQPAFAGFGGRDTHFPGGSGGDFGD